MGSLKRRSNDLGANKNHLFSRTSGYTKFHFVHSSNELEPVGAYYNVNVEKIAASRPTSAQLGRFIF